MVKVGVSLLGSTRGERQWARLFVMGLVCSRSCGYFFPMSVLYLSRFVLSPNSDGYFYFYFFLLINKVEKYGSKKKICKDCEKE